MTDASEQSLGDDATFAGYAKRQRADVSLGDQRTLGDGLSAEDTLIDDIKGDDFETRYRIEGQLGQGGMGAVLLATDTRLDRKVAIKRILGEVARNRMAVQRFLTEAKAIAAINHQNIVQIYDYGRAKDGPFLIMEFVDGGSLLEHCRDGAMPLEDAVDLACQLCDGLAKAHDLGIIHRDIKPANVLLTKDGIPKLTDFGLAKAQAGDHGQTMAGAVLGTPDFMPPEQRRDASEVDARSDLWSLAATVYQMVSGRSPKIIRFKNVPESIQEVLEKALEDSKDARYQTAREFREALTICVNYSENAASPESRERLLQEGECRACGTVTTDLTKKFCRNPKCGASLRVTCLKCDTQMPVWDEVCGECGGNQPSLTESRREAAVRDVVGILNSRVIPLKVSRQLELARTSAAAYDDEKAIAAIELIPAPMRCEESRALLATCRSRQEETSLLTKTVRGRVAADDLDGLMPMVARLLELQGDTDEFISLQRRLLELSGLKKQQERHARHAACREKISGLRAAREAHYREAVEACVSAGIAAEATRCVFETTAGPIVSVVQRSWSPEWALWFANAVRAAAFDLRAIWFENENSFWCDQLPDSDQNVLYDLADPQSLDPELCVSPDFHQPAHHKPAPIPAKKLFHRYLEAEGRPLIGVRPASDRDACPVLVLNSSFDCNAAIGWIDRDASADALTAFREARNRHFDNPGSILGVIKTVRMAAPTDRWDLPPRLQQGLDSAIQSRWEESVAAFEAAVAEDPQEAKAWVGIGQGLKQLGRLDEGTAAMERAFAANPQISTFLYNLACYQALAGHAAIAVDFLAKAVAMRPEWQEAAKKDPDFAAIRRDKTFLAVVGDREPARRLQAELKQGLALAERGRCEEAVAALRGVTERHPHVMDAWLAIGRCLKKLNRPADAAEAMRLGLRALRRHPRLLYNLACYHSLAGHDTESLRALMTAISLHPQYTEAAKTDRDFDQVRSDPRFAVIVAGAKQA